MNAIRRCKPLLGTFVEVSVQDNVSDKALINLTDRVFDEISLIERSMSFHDVGSELSKINRIASQQPVTISENMHQVLKQALTLSDLTQGRYDVSIAPKLVEQHLLPNHGYQAVVNANWQDIDLQRDKIYFKNPLILDLGGIAKGFAVDKAVSTAEGCEITVNAGGDLKMSHWQGKAASIRLPKSPIEKQFAVPMQAASLASSGHYFLEKNTMAIIDPIGDTKPDTERSVSVFAESCMLADALTKVVYLDNNVESLLSNLSASAMQFNHQGLI